MFFASWVPSIQTIKIFDLFFSPFFCQSVMTPVGRGTQKQKTPVKVILCIAQFFCVTLEWSRATGERKQRKATFDNKSFYHNCSSSAWVLDILFIENFPKIKKKNGKCVNVFQHWYTCCTVAHVFYVNMLPRGSSLKTDVKFNTCLTNKINVRFFVKCQLLFNALCFWYYLRKKKNNNKKKTGFNYFAMDKTHFWLRL